MGKTMLNISRTIALALAAFAAVGAARAADLDYGKPGSPVSLVVGYQPYDSEAWSAVVVNGLSLWKKYLPAGSTVEFRAGLQGSVIVNQMLAGKESIGYIGDMPAIVGATKRGTADLRIVAAIGSSHDQCDILLARTGAPQFSSAVDAIKWLGGRNVAAPKGSCADRFARAIFAKYDVQPAEYLSQSIEVITGGFRAGKLDAAVVWEPTASRLVAEGLARRAVTGNDVGESDGTFIDAREDLIRQRPDVVKAWLEAELDAERYIADPSHAVAVVKMAAAQTTGFTDQELWQSLYGTYTAGAGGSAVRLTLPFGFSDATNQLIANDVKFLYSIKSIAIPALAPDAVQPQFTQAVLQEQGLSVPVSKVAAQPSSAWKPGE